MAAGNLVCCYCKKIIRPLNWDSNGLDSHGACEECAAKIIREQLYTELHGKVRDCDHIFIEEKEPGGRLILPECLVCGLPAYDALDVLKKELDKCQELLR